MVTVFANFTTLTWIAKVTALQCAQLCLKKSTSFLTLVASFQSNAHKATFILIAAALDKTARPHTVLSFSYTLRYHTTRQKNAAIVSSATLLLLLSIPETISKGGTCSRTRALAGQVTSTRNKDAQTSQQTTSQPSFAFKLETGIP